MAHRAHKSDRDHQDDAERQDDDDLWTWVVIAVIFITVTLALYVPLIWSSMHAV
jgi:hypothetical protein